MQCLSLTDWSAALDVAHNNPQDAFWESNHMNIRCMPRNAVNEVLMVEKMWSLMGPLEHRWFSRFMPEVCYVYPEETAVVHPWNVDMAVQHYGKKPLLHFDILTERELGNHMVRTLDAHAAIAKRWKQHRQQHGLATNAWQSVQELVDSLHARDTLAFHKRSQYPASVPLERLKALETMVPDNDWVLALACAGIPTDRLQERWNAKQPLAQSECQALSWLYWWLNKSPDCMDSLAWDWVNRLNPSDWTQDVGTTVLQGFHSHAKDARDVFVQARQLYGDLKENPVFTISSSELGDAFSMP